MLFFGGKGSFLPPPRTGISGTHPYIYVSIYIHIHACVYVLYICMRFVVASFSFRKTAHPEPTDASPLGELDAPPQPGGVGTRGVEDDVAAPGRPEAARAFC